MTVCERIDEIEAEEAAKKGLPWKEIGIAAAIVILAILIVTHRRK